MVMGGGSIYNGFVSRIQVDPTTPQVSAGPDLKVAGFSPVTLAGTVSDDGLPNPPQTVTISWALEAGAGSVLFGDAHAAATTATFSTPGVYTLRLLADDSNKCNFDKCQITVLPAGSPLASAGPDQAITMPGSVPLAGGASDDSSPAPLSFTWSKVSGPGAVNFGNASAAATTASFTIPGVYVLRLTASDSALSDYDECQITVAPPPGNVAPAVSAGADRCVRVGTPGVSLAGSVSDDGLPSAGALRCTWVFISGPGTVSFASDSDPGTTASFSTDGTYLLRLVADDHAFLNYDDVQLTATSASLSVSINAPATIAVPSASLSGTVSDDGALPPGSITYTWSKVSGPGEIFFDHASAPSTLANFNCAGVYQIMLIASDGATSDTAYKTITVDGDLRADFNGDGRVDGLDFLVWQAHYHPDVPGATKATGDSNGDGKVDGLDFLMWQVGYGVWQ
jgi:hypothetical protein